MAAAAVVFAQDPGRKYQTGNGCPGSTDGGGDDKKADVGCSVKICDDYIYNAAGAVYVSVLPEVFCKGCHAWLLKRVRGMTARFIYVVCRHFCIIKIKTRRAQKRGNNGADSLL